MAPYRGAMTSGTTTARLLRLLSLLQTPRDWPGPALAERLAVSERTVRRDVERLRALGYRVHADRGSLGGYRLEAGTELPPLLLDDDQVTAIAVALQAVPLLGTDVDESAERALATIRRVMPPRLRRRAAALAFDAAPTGAQPSVASDVLVAVSAAVRAREVLRFDYRTGGQDGPPGPARRAEPHHLVATLGRWYVVAWDLDRADWRVFRADRMTPRTGSGPRFAPREVPGGDVHQFLATRFTGSTTPGSWPCRGTVVLDRPAPDVAPFAGDGVVEDLGDGTCRLTTGAWSWPALAALVARFDADVRVEGPDELRAACGGLAARLASAAGPTAATSGSRDEPAATPGRGDRPGPGSDVGPVSRA